MLIDKSILDKDSWNSARRAACNEKETRLAVFPERVIAFCATQKLSGRFISASRLHLPDVSHVISAFWAFNSNGWQRPQFLFFFAYHSYKLLWIMLDDLADFGFDFLAWFLLLVPAFRADKQ
jgi:hypothetical protein